VAAYKALGLGACTVAELEAALAALLEATPGERVPDAVELGNDDGAGSAPRRRPKAVSAKAPAGRAAGAAARPAGVSRPLRRLPVGTPGAAASARAGRSRRRLRGAPRPAAV
jgi:hypothetical protein